MATTSLTGRRGWTTVASLTAVLGALVAGQLPSALAADTPAPLVASPVAGTVLAAAAAAAPAPRRADLDGVRLSRRPGAVTLAGPAVRAAAPVRVAPVRPAATAPARPAAPRPAAARPAPARAAASTLCSGTGWQQRRGQAALASLRGGAGKAGYRISFEPARKGVMGLTYLDAKRIALFVRPCGTQSSELLRHVMAHELGHAHDTELMSSSERRAWMELRGIPASTPWYGCDGCSDFATPAGDFAEVYAQWARGASTNRSQLAGDVPPGQLAALAKRFF